MLFIRPLLTVLAAGLALAPAATAATLATDKRCYQEGADVVATGTGFLPERFVGVALDNQPLGFAVTTDQGIFRNKLVAPSLPSGQRERLHALAASDGTNTAIRHFRATQVLAGFSPTTGTLGTLRVRFHVYGFGLYKSGAKVYVHYVRPNGRLRHTVYLGAAIGVCGHIRRTSKRLLFPFSPERGTWKLQFDTRKGYYGKATAKSKYAWFRRTVQVGD